MDFSEGDASPGGAQAPKSFDEIAKEFDEKIAI
jgi:hypothetical protein